MKPLLGIETSCDDTSAAILGPNGTVLSAGGVGFPGYLASAEIYDPAAPLPSVGGIAEAPDLTALSARTRGGERVAVALGAIAALFVIAIAWRVRHRRRERDSAGQ